MHGLHLSFRVQSAGCITATIIFVVALVGLVLPAGYGAWYLWGGGSQWEAKRRIQKLTTASPARDARESINAGDYRLYVHRVYSTRGLGGPEERIVGMGVIDPDYAPGYRELPQIERPTLTPEEQRLNEAALEYARQYNLVLSANTPDAAKQPQRIIARP